MLGLLILAFVAVPILELVLLLRLGDALGFLPTLLLILLTGVAGAALARSQGLSVLNSMRRELGAGQLPVARVVDGALILAAGLLLLTPGVLTDVVGLLLLVPPLRALARRGLAARMRKLVESGRAQFTFVGGDPPVDRKHGSSSADRPAGRDVSDL